MKKIRISFIVLLLCCAVTLSWAQGVAINTTGTQADASAILDVSSDSLGIIIPRMTLAQRNDIDSPATGLMIYQTDNNRGFYYFNGTYWKSVGFEALELNDLLDGKTNGYSFFLGYNSGLNDDGNNWNTGVGEYVLSENTNGQYNTALGYASMLLNESGQGNAALGNYSLYQNTSGFYNTAIGRSALSANYTGSYNTGIGFSSLSVTFSGSCNTAVGYRSGQYLADGSNNTMIGYEAGYGTPGIGKSGCVFLGYQAGYNENDNNRLYIENSDSDFPLIYGEFDNDLLRFNGAVELANDTLASSLKFYESDTAGANFSKFQAQDQSQDITYTLPANNGSNGSVLKTDGSGLLSWTGDLQGAYEINDLLDGKTDANCVFLGLDAGFNFDDAFPRSNVAVGHKALYTCVSCDDNTAIGFKALYSNDSYSNTAIGSESLFSNTSGQGNTATGRDALFSNTEGEWNTADGFSSLYSNTTGNYNEAIGYRSLHENTTGSGNISIGKDALYWSDTGSYNTCIGYQAGLSNQGSGNVFIGAYASSYGNNLLVISNTQYNPLIYGQFDNKLLVVNGTFNINGEYEFPLTDGTFGQVLRTNGLGILNWDDDQIGAEQIDDLTDAIYDGSSVFLGAGAGPSDDGSNENLGIGHQAMNYSTSGTHNTALGNLALYFNDSGSKNTAVGYKASYDNYSGNENTAVGYLSLYSNGASYNTGIGYHSLKSNNVGASNTACGHSSMLANLSGNENTAMGYESLNTNTNGDNNTAVGSLSLSSNQSGSGNTAIGYSALTNSTGTGNTASGSNALFNNTSSYNTANGYYALYSCTSGDNNTAVGHEALYSITTGVHNTAIGAFSLYSNTGNYNTANGVWALNSNTSGDGNIAFGYRASYENVTGESNTIIGYDADLNNQSGSRNTIIGYESGQGTEYHHRSGCVLIGYQAAYNDTTSNILYIENSNSSSPLIWGDFENDVLRVNGTLDIANQYQFPTSDGTTGQLLQTDGSGLLDWNDLAIDDLSDAKTQGNNVYLGKDAGVNDNNSNNQNVAVGRQALNANTSGDKNVALGYYALNSNTEGQRNVSVGYNASLLNTIGLNNTTIGQAANSLNQKGSNNTIIGYQAGKGNDPHSKSGNVYLGYRAGFSDTTDNKLYIENSALSTPLIYGEFDNDIVAVNGDLGVGTMGPDEKFEVEFGDANKDVEIGVGESDPDVTFITLRSPNGTKFYITVNDFGNLVTTTTHP